MTNAERHTALLRAIASRPRDRKARAAYADFLQETGNPGGFVVANYPPEQWIVAEGAPEGYTNRTHHFRAATSFRLPWLATAVTESSAHRYASGATIVKNLLVAFSRMSPEQRGDT